jgi:hypothetical protein
MYHPNATATTATAAAVTATTTTAVYFFNIGFKHNTRRVGLLDP